MFLRTCSTYWRLLLDFIEDEVEVVDVALDLLVRWVQTEDELDAQLERIEEVAVEIDSVVYCLRPVDEAEEVLRVFIVCCLSTLSGRIC
jgi:uncharacterized Zn finger protein